MAQIFSGTDSRSSRLAVLSGFLAAVLASSCCLGPLLLVSLGVSGAWIGNLKALEAWQPLFITLAVAFIAVGLWRVYSNPRRACLENSSCDSPIPNRMMKFVLWISVVLVLAALTMDMWAPFFY